MRLAQIHAADKGDMAIGRCRTAQRDDGQGGVIDQRPRIESRDVRKDLDVRRKLQPGKVVGLTIRTKSVSFMARATFTSVE